MDEFTVRQVADILKVSTRRVRQMIQEGKIEARKIGRDWIVNAPYLALYRKKQKKVTIE